MFVPEVMMSAKAMNIGLDIIKPLILEKDMTSAGIVVLGAVKGDLHDIGKNLVKMMLESSGFRVIDAGIDVSAETFVALVEKHNAQVVGLAALLTTTMLQMKNVIQALEEKGLLNQVKVLVGGAPISEEFAKEIGADGYAADAGAAVAFCRQVSA
ncbi:cobalamin-dependent protein, partial [Sporomusa sp.]|uniref:cobalamin-dependent protein n=1 Tax=Sporomusa sp. TaxID=2078658 RepID=UPI002B93C047